MKVVNFLFQLGLLIALYHTGNYIAHFFNLKIPGNVIGMVLLLCLLWLKVIKLEQIESTAKWLLKHLGFFFIPISVGLMTMGDIILKNGIPLLIILIVSALVGLITAGRVTQFVIERKEEMKVNAHDHHF